MPGKVKYLQVLEISLWTSLEEGALFCLPHPLVLKTQITLSDKEKQGL